MNEKDLDRRSFFRMTLAALAITPFALKSVTAKAAPAGCPTAPPAGKQIAKPGEGMAKSQEYVEDSNTSKNAKHKAGQSCGNCKYFNDKKAEGGYAPCTMLGMKYVTNCGWCKAYLKK